MEVAHSHDGQELEELAAGVKREVAYFGLREFHALLTKCSDVLYVQVLPSVVHPAHNFVADYNKVDLKVVADVPRMRALWVEDAMQEGRALDSRREGKGFAHMAMQYSARRDVEVVLDP